MSDRPFRSTGNLEGEAPAPPDPLADFFSPPAEAVTVEDNDERDEAVGGNPLPFGIPDAGTPPPPKPAPTGGPVPGDAESRDAAAEMEKIRAMLARHDALPQNVLARPRVVAAPSQLEPRQCPDGSPVTKILAEATEIKQGVPVAYRISLWNKRGQRFDSVFRRE